VLLERGGGGLLAHIFQHEVDHLDGILFVDKARNIEEHMPEDYDKNPNTYRIAFWGTPALTVLLFRHALCTRIHTNRIITGEDKPQGRGMAITPPATKVWATQHNVKVLQPKKLDEDFL
jgi:hypothetical protein